MAITYTTYQLRDDAKDVIRKIYSDCLNKLLKQAIQEVVPTYKWWDEAKLVEDSNGNYIGWSVSTENARAFVQEYGSGENIDNNPYFAEYKNSWYWNPLRTGKQIVGRPAGDAVVFDWETGKTFVDVFAGHSPGEPIRAKGYHPRPIIDKMLKEIKSKFETLVQEQANSEFQKQVSMRFDELYVKKKIKV